MRTVAAACLILLAVLAAAVYLPALYGKLFYERVRKTHLFYSPVTEGFVYKEKILGEPPPEAFAKAEDHHAETAYRDEDGRWYTRREFEERLPFIYYKNMEIWGRLPLQLNGRTLDKETIQANRQVLELRSGQIRDRRPEVPLWPLLESNPGQARLVFPADRFRMTRDAMVFVNADTNAVDPELTRFFTEALRAEGFDFPARSVHGKFTVLKPFDEGVFIVDADHEVFHVKRVDDRPRVVRTPIDPAIQTRHIQVSENQRREFFGLLLGEAGDLYLLTCDDYRLIQMPLTNYVPDRMDFKLILNPLYRTAIYSDERVIRAVAMDLDYRPIDRYTHVMAAGKRTPAHWVQDLLFPFSVELAEPAGGYLRLRVDLGGWISLAGMALCLLGFGAWKKIREGRLPGLAEAALVGVGGVYGLLAVQWVESD
ncbi:MAG: DUF4857 domain-containing protein [Desulfococcaceae bacterium]